VNQGAADSSSAVFSSASSIRSGSAILKFRLVPYMATASARRPLHHVYPRSYSLCQLLAAPFLAVCAICYGLRPILISQSSAGACVSTFCRLRAQHLVAAWLRACLAGFMAVHIAGGLRLLLGLVLTEARCHALYDGAANRSASRSGPPFGVVLAGKDPALFDFVARRGIDRA